MDTAVENKAINGAENHIFSTAGQGYVSSTCYKPEIYNCIACIQLNLNKVVRLSPTNTTQI
jgi:hypothetical protein